MILLTIGISSKAQEVLQPPKDGKIEFPSESTDKTLTAKYKDGRLTEIQRIAKSPKNEHNNIELIGDVKLKRTAKGVILSSTKSMIFVPFQTGEVLNLGNRVAWECNCNGCTWPTCTGGECCYPTFSHENSIYKIGGGGGIIITPDDVNLQKNDKKTGGGTIVMPDDVADLKNISGKVVAQITGGGGITIIIDNF